MAATDKIIAFLKSNEGFAAKVSELFNELRDGLVPLSRNLVFNTRFGSTSFRKNGFNFISISSLANEITFGVKEGILREDTVKNIIDISNLSLHSMVECSFALSSSRIFTTIARMYPNKLNLDEFDEYEFSSSSFIITRLSVRNPGYPVYEAVSFGVRIFDDETEVKLSQMILRTLIINYP